MVKSVVALKTNSSKAIKEGLYFEGPVNVGVGAFDSDFMAYESGIFDKETCSTDYSLQALAVGLRQRR
jgi:hypothetical protein